jgi:Fic family protein
MRKSTETTQIFPFNPRAFPPRRLRKKSIKPLLEKADDALKQFALTLSPISTPLLACLLKIEAIDSLDSQKIGVSFKEVLQKMHSPIYDYLEALHWASRKIKRSRFSKSLICNIHDILKRSSSPQEELGKFRNRQNWIGPAGCTIEEAYFYPPKAENVEAMMNGLVKYMNSPSKEPLLQLALLFAQLLIIHPFMDGNGRVARSLTPLFLYKKNLLQTPFFLMSRYFKIHKLRYFQTLFQTTEEGNWENWITFFLKGIIQSSKHSKRTLTHIHSLHEKLQTTIPDLHDDARTFLFQSPLFSASSFTRAGGSSSTLKQLKKQRFIHRLQNRRYTFAPLMKILNTF